MSSIIRSPGSVRATLARAGAESLPAPRTPRTKSVRAAFPHTSLSRVHQSFLSCLVASFFCSTRAASIRAFFHPDRTFPSPSRARARRQAARDRVVGRAMIRGEPAIGREQSREPRLYSVEPTWGLDHEAVIRFCGQGSEAAGPFSQRHCSHSRIRIAATSDRHRLPGSSNAVRCRTLFVLSRSRVLLECCSRRRPQLDTVRHLTGRDQTPQRYQQLARQCHDHCRLARAARTLGPRAIPLRQRTVFLEHQEAPRQLDQPTSYPRIAGLGQALLSAFQTALIGRSREPGIARSSISKI